MLGALRNPSFRSRFLLLQNHLLRHKSTSLNLDTQSVLHKLNLKSSLTDLKFINTAAKSLPIDENPTNKIREVTGCNYSKVAPRPKDNPRIASLSVPALELLDLDKRKLEQDPDTALYLAGNKLIPGSEPLAHCYCGHQFGSFAGQLGDGRAISLGDIRNSKGEIWDLQLKGAGETPYSRFADGKAVLRSSIREYLCSEAMWALGIPTTRAASLVITDTYAQRDPFYNGNVKNEQCAVVLRLAPTFWRFGSFEIFKGNGSGRGGPSKGLENEMMPRMLNYVLDNFYPDIAKLRDERNYHVEACWLEMFKEIVRRTARLVALWQCYGFCHGVLNTDNMSMLGLTIDYGPFGWMDYFNKGHICNTSDEGGRYSYENQPAACKWNLFKLADALESHMPLEETAVFIEEEFDKLYYQQYYSKMGEKLGLFCVESEKDKQLINELFELMHNNASDFTNTFRRLTKIQIPKDASENTITDDIVKAFAELSPEMELIIARAKPRYTEEQIQKLVEITESNPDLLRVLHVSPAFVEAEKIKLEKWKKLTQKDEKGQREEIEQSWRTWLEKYQARLAAETLSLQTEGKTIDNKDEFKIKQKFSKLEDLRQHRVTKMNQTNPAYVLRNYIAEEAIRQAEKGDFSKVNSVLELLLNPFDANEQDQPHEYTKTPPRWANQLCVSCSS